MCKYMSNECTCIKLFLSKTLKISIHHGPGKLFNCVRDTLQSMLSFRQQIFDAVRTFEWVTTHMKILNIPSTAYNALFSNVRSNFFCFWKLGALPSPKIVISFAYFIWIINQYSRREILNSEMLPFVDLTCNKIATNAGKNLIHVSFSTQLLYPLLAYSLTYSIRNNALLAGLYNY